MNMNIFWKNNWHKEDYIKAMKKLDRDDSDIYYSSFAYLVSATGKTDSLLKYLTPTGVDSFGIKDELIKPYSKTERNMILFALQLFNTEMSDILLPDVFAGLDSYNHKCVLEAIKIRFN